MKKSLILATIFFTIFLDFFNLGLIYPIFTSLVFEGNGNLIPLESSEFYKNAIFGVLLASLRIPMNPGGHSDPWRGGVPSDAGGLFRRMPGDPSNSWRGLAPMDRGATSQTVRNNLASTGH